MKRSRKSADSHAVLSCRRYWRQHPDPQKDLNLDPLEPQEDLYKDYIGVIMALYNIGDLICRSSRGFGQVCVRSHSMDLSA